jgi:hypothetical protein
MLHWLLYICPWTNLHVYRRCFDRCVVMSFVIQLYIGLYQVDTEGLHVAYHPVVDGPIRSYQLIKQRFQRTAITHKTCHNIATLNRNAN